jgi:hypothetical protein
MKKMENLALNEQLSEEKLGAQINKRVEMLDEFFELNQISARNALSIILTYLHSLVYDAPKSLKNKVYALAKAAIYEVPSWDD